MSSSEQLHPNFSVEEIAKIMKVLTRHSFEDPCHHSFEEVMERRLIHEFKIWGLFNIRVLYPDNKR